MSSQSPGPDDAPDLDMIAEIAKLLASARSVLFITGAGISAESGLPTYRGIGGLYNDADTEEGIPIEVALSGQMLSARPEVAWKHIYRIESACRGARANRAHEIIAAIEKKLPRVWVLTQNVDGFHGAAGTQNLIEIHGNVHHLRCTRCAAKRTVTDYEGMDIPPYCDSCGALIRPEVVLFGEMLPQAPLVDLLEQSRLGFDVVFSVGTTSVFPYIAQPVLVAAAGGKPTVEINPGNTEVSDVVDYRVRTGARAAFEAIWSAFLERLGEPT